MSRQRPGFSQAMSSQMSQSQPQPSQAKSLDDIDPQEKEKKVDELVQYLLVMDQKKLPIKKRDINKTVLKDCSKAFAEVMEKSSAKLKNVFGFKVIELDEKLKGTYILLNSFDNHEEKHLECWSEEDSTKMALLSVILSMIFMNGNVINDEDMWHALKCLGVNKEETHDVFGDVKHLIQEEFERQGYLEVCVQPNTDPPVKEVRWGQRAKHEYPKRYALQLVCDIYQNEPKDWLNQWQQVLQETPQANVEAMEEG